MFYLLLEMKKFAKNPKNGRIFTTFSRTKIRTIKSASRKKICHAVDRGHQESRLRKKVPLRKAGRFLVVSLLLTVRLIVTCGSRVSRSPPRHTFPAFLNLHGRKRSNSIHNKDHKLFSPTSSQNKKKTEIVRFLS